MRTKLIRKKERAHRSSDYVNSVNCDDLYHESDLHQLPSCCEAGTLIKIKVDIVLHYACIHRMSFDIWKDVANRKFFVRCGYGSGLLLGGFSTTHGARSNAP